MGKVNTRFSGDMRRPRAARSIGPLAVALFFMAVLFHPVLALAQNIITIAGDSGGLAGYGADGILATRSEIDTPTGIVVDAGGNVYFSDSGNHRVRKITAGGSIVTVAGTGPSAGYGGDGGQATSASLDTPAGLALDSAGNLYIADSGNHRIRRVATNGVITTVAGTGTPGFSGDAGLATAAQLDTPRGIAVDGAGNLYIADSENDRIRRVDTGGTITTVVGTGVPGLSGDGGAATSAQVSNPTSIVVAASGVYAFVDQDNHRVRVVESGVIDTVAGTAPGYSGDGGDPLAAALNNPSAIALDSFNNDLLYISDTVNQRIRVIDFSVGEENGGATPDNISTIAGIGVPGFSGEGGLATSAKLNFPSGVAVDADGNLYIADTQNHRIRKVVARRLVRIAGGGPNGDGGLATASYLLSPEALARDSAGNVYIADYKNNVVRKIDTGGVISTFAGNGSDAYSGDGGPATSAGIGRPSGLAVDSDGNVYIAMQAQHRVRMVNTGGIISTVAGTGEAGFSGDGGAATAARLDTPFRLAVDANDDLYISDLDNFRVRKVAGGVINTIAGDGTNTLVDGVAATSSGLGAPSGMFISGGGDLYIADASHNRVRRVSGGIITTVAGTSGGFSGDTGQATSAQLNGPRDVVKDGAGNLFIADSGNSRIRKVDNGGIISTYGGSAPSFLTQFGGDGGPATSAKLGFPAALVLDGAGGLLLSDVFNLRVRKIDSGGTISTIAGGTGQAGDGGEASQSNLMGPYDVHMDTNGALLISDRGGHVLRKIAGGSINTIVGGSFGGSSGYAGDGSSAAAAQIAGPTGVITNSAGDVFFADRLNHRVRKIDASTGLIETVAGNGTQGFSGDSGPATSAQLARPNGIALDSLGNLYIADTANNRIRKVDTGGTITTIAGATGSAFTADGNPAAGSTLSQPFALAFDGSDVLHFVEINANRVRKIVAGNLVTVAGNGTSGSFGDGGQAINAQLSPHSIAFDPAGNLYISNGNLCRVRWVDGGGIIRTLAGSSDCATPVNETTAAIGNRFLSAFGIGYGNDQLFIADVSSARVRAVQSISPPSAPDAPIASPGDFGATVVFDPPSDDGGSPVTGYTVLSSPSDCTDPEAGSLSRNRTLTCQNNFVNYSFTVVATNAAGNSPESDPSNTVTTFLKARPRAYVGQRLNGSVDVFDLGTQSVIANVATGTDPTSVAVDPTGTRVYVTNQTSNTVSVINAETNAVISNVTAGFSAPVGIVVHPDGSKYYVGDFLNNRIVVLATGSNTVLNNIALGGPTNPISNLAMNPTGTRLYVGSLNFNQLKVIDTADDTIVASIPLGGTGPWGIAIHPEGHRAYVALYSSDLLGVYDLDNNTAITTIAVGDQPHGVAIHPDGDRVYVANELSHTVSVIDTDSNTVTNTIATGAFGPSGVAFQPDGDRAYVTFGNNGGVRIIDTNTETVLTQMGSGGGFVGLGNFIGEPPAKVPNAPTIGTATGSGNQAVVAFTPTYDGGRSVAFFTATSSPGGLTATCATSPCTVTGLGNGTSYTFTVVATNDAGDSLASAASNSITTADVPGAPTIGTATAGNGQASITFTPPGSDGGSVITSYTATSSPGGITGTCVSSPCVVTGLGNGTSYTFTVFATNAVGDGPASAASNAVTPATVPAAPTIGTATAGNGQATVGFTPPGSNGGSVITSYTATSNPGGITGTCGSPPCIVTGLANGTSYTFNVFATNAVGNSPVSASSNTVTPAAVPDAPTIGTATAGNGTASVTFTAGGNGGSAITGFTATSSPGGITGTCASSPCVVSGLSNGTSYTFTVFATNAVGNSAASAASNAVTPATVPDIPTIGTATAGNGQALVGFTPPGNNGGSAITGYTATSTPGGLTGTCAFHPAWSPA